MTDKSEIGNQKSDPPSPSGSYGATRGSRKSEGKIEERAASVAPVANRLGLALSGSV
jgi:hypothetical protein